MTEDEVIPIHTVSRQLPAHPGIPLAILTTSGQFSRFWSNYKTTCAAALRDGLQASQACAIIEDREHLKMTETAARARLDELLTAWRNRKGRL